MLKINSKAPLFKLNSTDGEVYSLKDSLSKYVVLYFYPKDDTPGCTIETNDFNKLLPKLKKAGSTNNKTPTIYITGSAWSIKVFSY